MLPEHKRKQAFFRFQSCKIFISNTDVLHPRYKPFPKIADAKAFKSFKKTNPITRKSCLKLEIQPSSEYRKFENISGRYCAPRI